jgi:hypothetical protein
MANVLTDLAADIYTAADVVARELVGVIPASLINANDADRAALGDTVRSHTTNQATANDVAPSMTIPEGDDQTVGNKTMTLSKSRAVQIPWTGEDMRHVNNGAGFETIYGDQIAQAMRTLTNEMEVDLSTEGYRNASRAVGTAGTTPFSSNFDLIAEARKILVDNGTPTDGQLTLALNTAAGTKLRNLAQLQRANENGSDRMLRNGVLLDLQGLMLRESAGIQSHTKGTGANFVTNGTFSEGDTAIDVDGGTGTIVAGDIITFANDDNEYVVAEALSGGTVTIAEPGLQQSLADGVAVTVGDDYTGNIAFHRNALEIAMRAPALPQGGDAAVDRMTIQDPFSGMVFEVSAYKGYKKAMFEVAAVWGVKAWKPEFIASLKG